MTDMDVILTNDQIRLLNDKTLWELLFNFMDNDPYIYEEEFSYDDMKIITVVSLIKNNYYYYEDLCYEDMCVISIIIRNLWNAAFSQKHNFPNLLKNTFGMLIWEIVRREYLYSKLNNSTEGYSQIYAERVCKDIIEKYLEFGRK